MPNKSNCCSGSNPTEKYGQYRYELLFTSLVSDEAIARGIVTRKNVTPILFFFIRVAQNPIVGPWLMPTPAALKEGRWLQVVNWLMDQYVFLEGKENQRNPSLMIPQKLIFFQKKVMIIEIQLS